MTKNVHQNRDLLFASEHFDQLHTDAHGVVMIWEKLADSKRWLKLRPQTEAANALILGAQKKGLDRYISVNEFEGWRCVRDLKSLRSCFVDIDGVYDFEWVMEAVTSAGLPTPTMAVFSGRGTHLYWQIDAVPRSSLPLWQMIQTEIVKRMAEAPEALVVDRVVKDCTRMLRLIGSVNSKNQQEVRGLVIVPWKWNLEILAYEVLGFDQVVKPPPLTFKDALALDVERESAAVRSFAAAKARKGTASRTTYGSIYQWWGHVYRDLIKIGDANLLGIPLGHRDSWLFAYATALSWFAEPDSLAYEVRAIAKSYTQGLRSEVDDVVATTLARAEASRAKKTIEWKGEQRDPRIHFKRETLLATFEPIIPEDLYPQLRAIIPDALRAERRQERFAARYDDHNTGDGVRASNQQKRATARLLKAQGQSLRDIAAELGVAVKTVQNWTAAA